MLFFSIDTGLLEWSALIVNLTQPELNWEESLSEVLSALGWPAVLYM